MIVRRRCPGGAILRRRCALDLVPPRPCRCKGGPVLLVDLEGAERELCARPPRKPEGQEA